MLGGVFDDKAAFLGPWSGRSIEDWTIDMRRREREILAKIINQEGSAVAKIEKALAAMK